MVGRMRKKLKYVKVYGQLTKFAINDAMTTKITTTLVPKDVRF